MSVAISVRVRLQTANNALTSALDMVRQHMPGDPLESFILAARDATRRALSETYGPGPEAAE